MWVLRRMVAAAFPLVNDGRTAYEEVGRAAG
jgi:hypothetical protein